MNAQPPPLPGTPPSGKVALSPMVLSALVYPGAGQLLQRRWVAGIFYMVLTTLVTIWLVSMVYVVLKAYYGLAFDPMNAPAEVPGVKALIIPFVVWVAIYFAGIIDTAVAMYRQRVRSAGRPEF